jgi:PAS domain S-box-containing protein
VVEDISERKRIEEKLQESEIRFRGTFEQAAVGIAHTEAATGHFIRINQKYLDIVGYTRPELLGRHFQEITHPDDVLLDLEYTEQLLNGEISTYAMEKRYLRRDGSPVWVNLTVSLVRKPSGEPVYFIPVIEDISERKQAEAALAQQAAELERSNQDLEQFAYVASHDLQEPLRMVSSYLKLLERRYRDKLDTNAQEFIGFAVDGASRMQRLIQDLLTYSRIGTRGKTLQPVAAEQVLQQALKNLQIALEESHAEISHDPLPTIMADEGQLVQLLQNLVGNALKFHREQALRIHVGVQAADDQWLFSVADNGIGIDPAMREAIFIIFKRLHTREAYAGTGIGLAMCKKIVERHGGRIWVESEPGQGATFYFTIPKTEAQLP